MTDQQLIADLKRDEDVRDKPYDDATGLPPIIKGKLSIGVGRNLTDVGLSPGEIDYLLNNDIARTQLGLDHSLPWWRSLDPVRARVLANMAFNMGVPTLLGFHNTLEAVRTGEWDRAAVGMLTSKWSTQVGDRAKRLAQQMRTGQP